MSGDKSQMAKMKKAGSRCERVDEENLGRDDELLVEGCYWD